MSLPDFKLGERIDSLPFKERPVVRHQVLTLSNVSPSTWSKVLSGQSHNFMVFWAIKEVVGCSWDELFDPDYQFRLGSASRSISPPN